ncbi:hypothetical protein EDB83DRAFT_2536418 [Lactarius deliciosus]|nr:hypothetical protein EDB83DRAFT_2536418 [Lactarius deliciosus]
MAQLSKEDKKVVKWWWYRSEEQLFQKGFGCYACEPIVASPHFSGKDDKIQSKDLADGNRLTEKLKGLTHTQFVELSAEFRIRDESEVLKYYRDFLTVAPPLLEDSKLTEEDFNGKFIKCFHLDDQGIFADQVLDMNPHHPGNQSFDFRVSFRSLAITLPATDFTGPYNVRFEMNPLIDAPWSPRGVRSFKLNNLFVMFFPTASAAC